MELFTIEEFQLSSTHLKICMSVKKVLHEEVAFSFKLRDKKIWNSIEYRDEILCNPMVIDNLYQLEIPLSLFIQDYQVLEGVKNIVDLRVKVGDAYYVPKQTFDSIAFNHTYDYLPLNNLVGIKPYITKGKKLAFKINAVIDRPVVRSIDDADKAILLSIEEVEGNVRPVYPSDISVESKPFPHAIVPNEVVLFDHPNEKSVSLSKERFSFIPLDQQEMTIEMKAHYKEDNVVIEHFLRRETAPLSDIQLNQNVMMHVKDGGNLSFILKRKGMQPTLEKLTVNGEEAILHVSWKNSVDTNPSIELYKEYEGFKQRQYFYQSRLPIKRLEENEIVVEMKISELITGLNVDRNEVIKPFLAYEYDGKKQLEALELITPVEENLQIEDKEIKFAGKDGLVIEAKKHTFTPYKIAILGSCYSRSAFNSRKSYFNPDYKSYFEIVYTNFQPSILSLNSDPVPFDEKEFADLEGSDLTNVQREYEKTAFQDLRELSFDYLIIDFFVDATHGAIQLQDGQLIGLNSAVKRSKQYKDHLAHVTQPVTNKTEGFIEKWIEQCDAFIETIKTILPENKIILNTGGLVDQFYDKQGNIQSFVKKNYISKEDYYHFNEVWQYLNNYFIHSMPEIRVIDLNKYGFIGSENHPVNAGPHHYESGYYKAYMNELLKVIVNRGDGSR